MKRLFAKLLSFLLMIVMTVSVLCRTSENFSLVGNITHLKSVCTETNSWEMSVKDKKLISVPYIGEIVESIAEPKWFMICLAVYFLLLFAGRKKNTHRSMSSDVYRYSDYIDYASVDDVSDSEISLEDISDSETS